MHTVQLVPAVVGCQSLIGARGELPLSWANYFWIDDIRIVNFWAENLEGAVERFLKDGMVTVNVFTEGRSKWGVIDDDRIPRNWYTTHPCFTGYGTPKDLDILRAIYASAGDTSDHIEQYINPKEYHEARGGSYREVNGMGIISYAVKSEPRALKGDWTIEAAPDIVVEHDPALVDELADAMAYAMSAMTKPDPADTNTLTLHVSKKRKLAAVDAGFYYAPYIPKELNATRLDSTDSSVDRSRQEDSQPKGTEAL